MARQETTIDGSDKKEVEKYKKEILSKVAEVIDNNGPFLILGNIKNEQVVTFGGGEDLVAMIASAMGKVKDLRRIFELSKEMYEYAMEEMAKKASDNPLNSIAEQLGCHTCPTKDDCDIYNSELIQEGEPSGKKLLELLEELRKKHPEIIQVTSKSQGEC